MLQSGENDALIAKIFTPICGKTTLTPFALTSLGTATFIEQFFHFHQAFSRSLREFFAQGFPLFKS